jgi:hypothetical protein
MKHIAAAAALVCALFSTSPAFAQGRTTTEPPTPRVELRPFGLFSVEQFTATTTLDATLDSSVQWLWGGGLQIAMRRNIFVDIAVSRMSRDGQRAFVDDTGHAFRLGIPLHATLTPVEFTVGRRFPPRRRPARRRRITVVPYVGVGAGLYRYAETSDFATGSENVDETHAGFLAVGGAEFRVSKWVGITADAQYTRVPGIFGQGGVSQQAGEHDLGGIAGRVRVILGR